MALINIVKCAQPLILRPSLVASPLCPSRSRSQKHWNPKFKKLRGLKVIKVDLPDFTKKEKSPSEMSQEELRANFKEKGFIPPRYWKEREMFMGSTRSIFEPYVPPEGDGKISPISSAGAKQKLDFLKKKTTTWNALRKIRQYDDGFELYPDFINTAQDLYIKAHTAMAENNKDELIKYVTEKAYGDIILGIDNKTIRWKFLNSIEPARVAHARVTNALTEKNYFAQITVRFHTQQTLVIYDRFGRLMYGSEVIAKDVLEYIVYEKHIVNVYGEWKIHDKIIPDWAPPREPTLSTKIVIPSGPSQAESAPSIANAEVNVPSEKSSV